MSVIKKLAKFLVSLIVVILIIVLITINFMLIYQKMAYPGKIPEVFGYKMLNVLTSSMETEIRAGDTIIVRTTNKLAPGDIITYKENNQFVTHRIVEIADDGRITTKGDANNTADVLPKDISNVEGKVVKVLSGIMPVSLFVKSPLGIFSITITAFAIAVSLIIMVNLKKYKKKKGENNGNNDD